MGPEFRLPSPPAAINLPTVALVGGPTPAAYLVSELTNANGTPYTTYEDTTGDAHEFACLSKGLIDRDGDDQPIYRNTQVESVDQVGRHEVTNSLW